MPAVQSKFGPDELRRSNAKIQKFNNVRKELVKDLNHFIEYSLDNIVLEQIKGEQYAETLGLASTGFTIGTGIAGLIVMFICPPAGLVLGIGNILIQVGFQFWIMKVKNNTIASKISEMKIIHEELAQKIEDFYSAEKEAFGELDYYAKMGTNFNDYLDEIDAIIRGVETEHEERFQEFREFVVKVMKFSPDIMEIIRLESNGIKMNDLLNKLIGLTPLASGAIATMAVVETSVHSAAVGVIDTSVSSMVGAGMEGLTQWGQLCPPIAVLNGIQILTGSYFFYRNYKQLQVLKEAWESIKFGGDKDGAMKKIAPDVFKLKEICKQIREDIQNIWG